MFNESLVVASAVSAFNNFAVAGPAFLWNAVLCAPVFIGIYLFIRRFSDEYGIKSYVTSERMTFWTVILTALWVVFMGGNYAVLRDGVSLLPWVTAAILFIACIFVGINTRAVSLPIWYGRKNVSKRRRWLINLCLVAICLVPVGFSGALKWWGPILQIMAVICGFLLGRYSHRQIRAVPSVLGVMFVTTVAVLMQPELWRFGQLGNLTPVHLLWMLVTGIMIAAAMALDMVNPRGRIHQSAYVKLKWLMRFTVALCMVLFVLTEAVPIFIAMVFMAFVSFAMSVWHSNDINPELSMRTLAWAIILFGCLISVPTITAIGIIWIALPEHGGHMGGGFLL